MKKSLFILIILFVVILCGELFSSPKTITSQRDNMNVWTVKHFFNAFTTEYLSIINDTTEVVVTDKISNSCMIHVSDGTTVTLLKSKDIYNFVEKGDTVKLVTIHEPINKHKYKIKHIVIK